MRCKRDASQAIKTIWTSGRATLASRGRAADVDQGFSWHWQFPQVLDVGPGEFPEQLGNTLNLGNDVTSKDTNASKSMEFMCRLRVVTREEGWK
jgi:hypothetical protein